MSQDQQEMLNALREALQGRGPLDADAVIQQLSVRRDHSVEDVVYVLAQAVADGVVEVDREQRLSLAPQPAIA